MQSAVQERRDAIARRHPRWNEMTLEAYLDRAAMDFGDRPLLLTDEVTLSYAQVVEQSHRIAAGFAALGIQAGDRVGVVMANYPVTVPLLFAIWRIGAVAVPMNTLYRPDELEYAIREADCALLVVMERFGSRNYAIELDASIPGWRDGRCATLPTLCHGLLFDVGNPQAFWDALPAGTGAPLVTADAQDAAVIMFTSGTTGSPKGVVQTHDNLLRGLCRRLSSGIRGRSPRCLLAAALPCLRARRRPAVGADKRRLDRSAAQVRARHDPACDRSAQSDLSDGRADDDDRADGAGQARKL